MTDAVQMATKSQLAKLLASENLTIQFDPNIDTAGFAVKERILYLPMWSNMNPELFDMLIGHEVSHALWTPKEWEADIKAFAKKNNIKPEQAKGLVNVVEDIRIDKMMQKKFPGLKYDYRVAHTNLWERDFFGLKANQRTVDDLFLPDRINVHYKTNTVDVIVPFDDEEKALLAYLDTMATWQEVLEGTQRMLDLTPKSPLPEMEMEGEGEDGEEGDGDETGDNKKSKKSKSKKKSKKGDDNKQKDKGESQDEKDGKDNDAGDDGSGNDDSDDDGDDKSDGSGGNDGNDDGNESDNGDGGDDQSDNEGEDDHKGRQTSGRHVQKGGGLPAEVCETVESYEKKLKSMVDTHSEKYDRCNMPRIVNTNKIIDYKTFWSHRSSATPSAAGDARLKSLKKDARYMVQQFERWKAADAYKHTKIARTGKLDTNRLHNYKLTDDVFLRAEIEPEAKNHGFIFILDWSGSMGSTIRGTMLQLIRLTTFCRMVSIPFEVYVFRSEGFHSTYSRSAGDDFSQDKGDIKFCNDFRVENIISSRMKAAEYTKTAQILLGEVKQIPSFGMGSTPLDQTILYQTELSRWFFANNKVQYLNYMYFTDGGSDGTNDIWGKSGAYGTNWIMSHPQTKSTKVLKGGFGTLTEDMLELEAEATRQRFPDKKVNVMGLFLCNGLGYTHSDPTNDQHIDFDKNGFVHDSKFRGYDEHFTLNSSVFNVSASQILNGETKDSLERSLEEMGKERRKQRILIDQYMKKICGVT